MYNINFNYCGKMYWPKEDLKEHHFSRYWPHCQWPSGSGHHFEARLARQLRASLVTGTNVGWSDISRSSIWKKCETYNLNFVLLYRSWKWLSPQLLNKISANLIKVLFAASLLFQQFYQNNLLFVPFVGKRHFNEKIDKFIKNCRQIMWPSIQWFQSETSNVI